MPICIYGKIGLVIQSNPHVLNEKVSMHVSKKVETICYAFSPLAHPGHIELLSLSHLFRAES